MTPTAKELVKKIRKGAVASELGDSAFFEIVDTLNHFETLGVGIEDGSDAAWDDALLKLPAEEVVRAMYGAAEEIMSEEGEVGYLIKGLNIVGSTRDLAYEVAKHRIIHELKAGEKE